MDECYSLVTEPVSIPAVQDSEEEVVRLWRWSREQEARGAETPSRAGSPPSTSGRAAASRHSPSVQGVSLGAPWQSPAPERLPLRQVDGEGGSAGAPRLSRGGEREFPSWYHRLLPLRLLRLLLLPESSCDPRWAQDNCCVRAKVISSSK